MRKIIVSEFVSLDGVMEDPQWTFQFNTDEQNQFKYDELKECDTLLLGRVTYEGFAAAWPKVTNKVAEGVVVPDDFADRMNNYPKFVVSTTLQEVSWNNSRLIRGNLVEEVSKLKQLPGKDILVAGSCQLVNTLMEHHLIDEYRLMVFPIVVGNGKRLFRDHDDMKVLKHVETKTFRSGVAVLTYEPHRSVVI
ncbi:dihydrofolate reductase family protein [Brevibacillus ruminantium]|uniref:Dihydrofolate reductase family protein n=1 Tax=Brevibacillus ruminantium TaxID=2950604 RepID=A0ABY4WGA3_9BACL|nr:dihydrofolate reductase family protein [Brevibacillus ruminantium]USG66112.1 dihydrofolate reductase family protein [Brevibacillus ruminantium]